jgi:hypothetical protein
MNWLTQSAAQLPTNVTVAQVPLAAAMVANIGALMVLGFLWRFTDARWLRWLSLAWAIWIVRYVLGVLAFPVWPIGQPVALAVMVARETALVMALRDLGARGLVRAWAIALMPVAWGTALCMGQGSTPAWYGWYVFSLLGAVWAVAAVTVVRTPRLAGPERWFAAIGFGIEAVLLAAPPWYHGALTLVQFSFAVATLTHLLVALGIAIGLRRRMFEDQVQAERRHARALEHVVRGLVPMCAYCRSVRDQGGRWSPLESFIAASTDAPVHDALCPDCAAGHRGGSVRATPNVRAAVPPITEDALIGA